MTKSNNFNAIKKLFIPTDYNSILCYAEFYEFTNRRIRRNRLMFQLIMKN